MKANPKITTLLWYSIVNVHEKLITDDWVFVFSTLEKCLLEHFVDDQR